MPANVAVIDDMRQWLRLMSFVRVMLKQAKRVDNDNDNDNDNGNDNFSICSRELVFGFFLIWLLF